MKTKAFLLTIVIIASASFNLYAQKNNARKNKNTECYWATTPKEPLSEAEKAELIHMADEEKLAGDVYETLSKTWNLPVFANITKAERRHEQNVLSLLNKYDIDFKPAKGVGKYNDPKYEELYNNLVAQGQKSITDALIVGATIEDLDIYDLDKALEKTDSQDIAGVFTNIRRASYNHMKAFTNNLKRYNATYTPQYISNDRYNEILNN